MKKGGNVPTLRLLLFIKYLLNDCILTLPQSACSLNFFQLSGATIEEGDGRRKGTLGNSYLELLITN